MAHTDRLQSDCASPSEGEALPSSPGGEVALPIVSREDPSGTTDRLLDRGVLPVVVTRHNSLR